MSFMFDFRDTFSNLLADDATSSAPISHLLGHLSLDDTPAPAPAPVFLPPNSKSVPITGGFGSGVSYAANVAAQTASHSAPLNAAPARRGSSTSTSAAVAAAAFSADVGPIPLFPSLGNVWGTPSSSSLSSQSATPLAYSYASSLGHSHSHNHNHMLNHTHSHNHNHNHFYSLHTAKAANFSSHSSASYMSASGSFTSSILSESDYDHDHDHDHSSFPSIPSLSDFLEAGLSASPSANNFPISSAALSASPHTPHFPASSLPTAFAASDNVAAPAPRRSSLQAFHNITHPALHHNSTPSPTPSPPPLPMPLSALHQSAQNAPHPHSHSHSHSHPHSPSSPSNAALFHPSLAHPANPNANTAPAAQHNSAVLSNVIGPNQDPSQVDPCNVFVKYLPSDVTDDRLVELFRPFGDIISAKVMVDVKTGQSLGYGFIRYTAAEESYRAIAKMSGFQVGNKTLLCKLSNSSANQAASLSSNLYIKPLPAAMSDDDLFQMFSPFGKIVECKVMVDIQTGKSKQVGFVRFDKNHEAVIALKTMNGRVLTGLNTPLSVKFAETDAQRACRKARRQSQPTLQTQSNSTSTSVPDYFGVASYFTEGVLGGSQETADEAGGNLFVFHLPSQVDDEHLRGLFSPFGPIESIKVISDLQTGESRGYGFVKFLNTEDAIRCVSAMNGYQIGNKRLKVSFKTPKSMRGLM